MCFPLYDILVRESVKDLSLDEKKDLAEVISNLDIKEQEIIFVLIRINFLKENSNFFGIPYKGVKKSNDIKFDLEKFPDNLVKILYSFTKRHLSTN